MSSAKDAVDQMINFKKSFELFMTKFSEGIEEMRTTYSASGAKHKYGHSEDYFFNVPI